MIDIDPREDFFARVIETRKTFGERDLSAAETKRLDRFLKVLANTTSYGIYAEMIRDEQPADRSEVVAVHRSDGESTFGAPTSAPEELGSYFFGPMAALITSAARLMLALAEREVTSRGGTYAFCDTDSLAIVATREGGIVECPGGEHRTANDHPAIRALSWHKVDEIRDRFANLNPYDRSKVKGSVLELEGQNFEDAKRT